MNRVDMQKKALVFGVAVKPFIRFLFLGAIFIVLWSPDHCAAQSFLGATASASYSASYVGNGITLAPTYYSPTNYPNGIIFSGTLIGGEEPFLTNIIVATTGTDSIGVEVEALAGFGGYAAYTPIRSGSNGGAPIDPIYYNGTSTLSATFGLDQAYSYTVDYSGTLPAYISPNGSSLASGTYSVQSSITGPGGTAYAENIGLGFTLNLTPISQAQLQTAQVNAISGAIKTQVTNGNTTISAAFSPNNNLNLAQAAVLFPNVVAFDWVQTAVFPSADSISLVSSGSIIKQLSNTVTDPNPTPGSDYQITRGSYSATIPTPSPLPNGAGFYYNPGNNPGDELYSYLSPQGPNAITLSFTDSPALPYWVFGENSNGDAGANGAEYIQFTTELWGVNASGQPVPLPGIPGNGFTWEDNIATDDSGNYYLSGGIINVQPITYLDGSGVFAISGGTLTVNEGNFAGVILDGAQSGGQLVMKGPGTLMLTGSNTYTGGTTIDGGILQLGDGITAGASLGSGPVTVNSGGTFTLDLANNETFGNNITDDNRVILDDAATSNYTVSSVISGTGSVNKSGANTITLTGSNSYNGGTTIDGGVLQTQNLTALGTGPVTLNGGGTLMPLGQLSINSLTWNGGTISMTLGTPSGTVQISGSLVNGGEGGTFAFAGTEGFALNTAYELITIGGSNNFTLPQYTGNALDGVNPTFALSGSGVDVEFLLAETQIGTVTGTATSPTIITGGSTAVTVTVVNADPGTLDVTLTGSYGVVGSATLSVSSSGTDTTGGLTYTGTVVGPGQLGTYVVSSTNVSYSSVAGTVTVNVLGHADPLLSGTTLNLGYAHVGYASTVTSANSLIVTNGTSGAYVADLSGSASGAGNLAVNSVSGISAGSSAMIAATLAPGQGVGAINSAFNYTFADDSTLPGASANVETASLTVTGEVYSGQSTWAGIGGGSWGTLASNFGINWGSNQGSPGLDPNFTSTDTATFGNTVGSGIAIVTLDGAAPSLAAITFNNTNASYLIMQGSGTSGIALNGGTSSALIQDEGGSHEINAPLALDTDVTATVTRAGDVLILSGAVSGAGGLTESGGGTLVLSGLNSYAGNTNVNGGILEVDGSIASASTYVNNGAALDGIGTIGGSVYNRGIVIPGEAPGMLHVSGNYTQSGNGTLVTQVGGRNPGQSSVLAIGGSANLNGTLQLVRLNNFTLAPGDKLPILTAAGGINGVFSSVQGASAFAPVNTIITAGIAYDSHDVYLEAVQGLFSAMPGLTPNQLAVARIIDIVADPDPRAAQLVAFLNSEPLGNLPNDFDLIAPEQLTALYQISFSAATVQQSNLENRMQDIRNGSTGFVSLLTVSDSKGTVELGNDGKAEIAGKDNDVFQPSPGNRWGMFVSGNGEFVNVDGDPSARGYDFTTGGVTLGLDGRVNENLAVGVAMDYAHTRTNLSGGGDIDADSGRLGIYATWFKDGFYFNGYAGGGYTGFDTGRSALLGTARGSTGGGEFDSFLGGGYDFHRGAWTFGPVASAQYIYAGIDSYTEAGSLAPLNIVSQGQDSVTTDLGWKVSYAGHVGKATVTPQLKVGWEHEYAYSTLPINSQLASGAGGVFTVYGPSMGRDSAMIELGVNVQWSERITAYLNYDVRVNTAYQSQNITGGMNISF